MDPVLLAVGAVVAVLAVAAVALNDTFRRRRRVRRRLAPLAGFLETDQQAPEETPDAESERAERPFVAFLDSRYPLAGGPRTAAIALACGIVAAVLLAPALNFVGLHFALAVPAAIAVGAGTAWTMGTFLEQRMRERFQDRLLVAVEDFERMARFGIGTGQAVSSMAASAEEPVRASLASVAHSAGLGVPLGTALAREAHRVRISEMAMLSAIVSTQIRTGGGLAEAVENLAQMLRERIDNRARLKAATAESKLSLLILAAVPFAAVGVLWMSQPQVIETLVGSARHLLGIGTGLIVTGLVVAFFLVRSTAR